ncbi:MAG TPA: CHAT domain-containing protein, partial [Pyrinomonadaceae bacterium]|nr:CHAT domain-containing protein [Pyrinomonadaceae bacterium]
ICVFFNVSKAFDEKDSSEIAKTLKQFYTNYENKNSAEWKKLWHDNSPIFIKREQDFNKWNLKSEPLNVISIKIEKGWDKTFAVAEIEISPNTEKRHIGLLKDGNNWKIWHETSLESFENTKKNVEASFSENEFYNLKDENSISSLNWLAYELYEKREFEKSLDIFKLADKTAQKFDDAAASVSSMIFCGHDYLESGKSAEALETYKKAYQTAQKAGFQTGMIRALSGIGNAANALGQYFESRNAQEKRLEMLRSGGNKTRLAITLKNLGNTYFYLGEYEKALNSYLESEKLGFQDVGLMLNIAAVLIEIGKYSEAEKRFQTGLLLAREANNSADIGRALNGIGLTAFKRGQFQESISFFRQSLKEGRDLSTAEQAKILLNQGYSFYKLQDFNSAIELTENAVKTAKEAESPEPIWFGEYVLGKILKKQNKSSLAQIEFEKSVDFIEDWLKKDQNPDGLESFFQDKVEPYRELIGLLADRSENEKALEFAELSKAKTLLKAVKGINQNVENYGKFSLKNADALIKDSETVLLEYVVAEDSTYIFVITKSAKMILPQLTVRKIAVSRSQLENSITNLRNKLAAENYDFADQSAELYDLLIRPVGDKLLNKKKLVIVPDSVIWGLPFQALKTNPSKFLWEQFSITYSRSLTALLHSPSKSHEIQKTSLLAIANPSAPISEQLPFAEESVKEISPLYKSPQTQIFTGNSATEEKIKSVISDYDIVHFATHGFLDNQSPMSSYLQLTTNDFSENGRLEANEIQNLKLKAELVVLAGCETGRGKLLDGEGIIGLAWALEKAGAPTLVTSFWKVRDKNTKELMTEFHRIWRKSLAENKPLRVSEALRLAALAIQKKNPHPFYWAGFSVLGNDF